MVLSRVSKKKCAKSSRRSRLCAEMRNKKCRSVCERKLDRRPLSLSHSKHTTDASLDLCGKSRRASRIKNNLLDSSVALEVFAAKVSRCFSRWKEISRRVPTRFTHTRHAWQLDVKHSKGHSNICQIAYFSLRTKETDNGSSVPKLVFPRTERERRAPHLKAYRKFRNYACIIASSRSLAQVILSSY